MSLKRYETIVIFAPELDDAGLKEQIERINTVVASHDGSIEKQEMWGRRQLAYRIAKKESGFYVLLTLTGDAKLVTDLDRQLKINDRVLRHMIVSKDKHAPDAAPHLKEGGDVGPAIPAPARDFDEEEEAGSSAA